MIPNRWWRWGRVRLWVRIGWQLASHVLPEIRVWRLVRHWPGWKW
jgi:hypothetical protein